MWLWKKKFSVSNSCPQASIGPRPVIRGVAAAPSPGQLRALSLPGNISPRTVVKMDAERRKIEKIRREAIRQALNK